MRTLSKQWAVYQPIPADVRDALALAARECDLPLNDLSLQLLYNRGVSGTADAIAFLKAGNASLNDPYRFEQMDVAVDRITVALGAGEKIAIYGDYDADGVTATALLVKALRGMGADVIPYIPHRTSEGYGMNLGALAKLQEEGVRLVITVDCGISNIDEVAAAIRDQEMDVIVTDHHRAPRNLPQANALISARRPDNQYPYKELTGVGVAYQLVRALIQRGVPLHESVKPRDLLELVAIGTVADVAPLDGDNRILVSNGLRAMRGTRSEGLRAIYAAARLKTDSLTTESIGFAIAPRINAAGRLDSAWDAYNLLMSEDAIQAGMLASQLEAKNQARQALTSEIVEQATASALVLDDDAPIIVVHGVGWNAGIVGLAAGRLKEMFNRPVIVIEEAEGMSKGSARSIKGFNVTDALTAVSDLLARYGGHSMAAGFSVPTANLPEFKRRLHEHAASLLTTADLMPRLEVDAELTINKLHLGLCEQLELLAPWGTGNPAPIFVSRSLRVKEVWPVGNGKHLKLNLYDRERHQSIRAIYWRSGDLLAQMRQQPMVDVVYAVHLNDWNGSRNVELDIKDLHIV